MADGKTERMRRELILEDIVGRIRPRESSHVCKACRDRGEYIDEELSSKTGEPYKVLRTCRRCRRGRALEARRRRPSDVDPEEDEPQREMFRLGEGE